MTRTRELQLSARAGPIFLVHRSVTQADAFRRISNFEKSFGRDTISQPMGGTGGQVRLPDHADAVARQKLQRDAFCEPAHSALGSIARTQSHDGCSTVSPLDGADALNARYPRRKTGENSVLRCVLPLLPHGSGRGVVDQELKAVLHNAPPRFYGPNWQGRNFGGRPRSCLPAVVTSR